MGLIRSFQQLRNIMSIVKWLWRTFLVKIGLRFDTYTVEHKKIGDTRAKITVKNERTGKETENTARLFTEEEIDHFRELEA